MGQQGLDLQDIMHLQQVFCTSVVPYAWALLVLALGLFVLGAFACYYKGERGQLKTRLDEYQKELAFTREELDGRMR